MAQDVMFVAIRSNNELMHYGVKGMKWGVRRAEKYEAKAKEYRSRAKEYDSDNRSTNLSNRERSKLKVKSSKFNAKAETMDVKARLAREGKEDLKKLREASKLKGHYTDTQGMLRGPYSDAVGSIRAQKGERYASELMKKHQSQEVNKLLAGIAAGSIAYAAGMAALIDRL